MDHDPQLKLLLTLTLNIPAQNVHNVHGRCAPCANATSSSLRLRRSLTVLVNMTERSPAFGLYRPKVDATKTTARKQPLAVPPPTRHLCALAEVICVERYACGRSVPATVATTQRARGCGRQCVRMPACKVRETVTCCTVLEVRQAAAPARGAGCTQFFAPHTQAFAVAIVKHVKEVNNNTRSSPA